MLLRGPQIVRSASARRIWAEVEEGGGGDPTPDWEENFEYANMTALFNSDRYIDFEAIGEGDMSIVSDGEGGSMLQVDWDSAYDDEHRLPLDIRISGNGDVNWPSEWWFEYQMKLSGTATQAGGPNPGANEWKYCALRPNNGSDLRFNFDGNTNGSHVYWEPNPVDNGILKSLNDFKNTWVTIRWHYVNATKTIWVQQGDSDVEELDSSAADNPYFISVTGMNRNFGVAASFEAYYRRLKRYDSDPGWTGF
jgi:hypothetical protein